MEIEKLIEILRGKCAVCKRSSCNGKYWVLSSCPAMCEAATALEQLQAENDRLKEEVQQMRWIPVEERLPGVSGNYICAVKDKNGSVWTIPAEWSLEMKMWIGAFGEIKNIVTHWMPLPEPPYRRPPEGEVDA